MILGLDIGAKRTGLATAETEFATEYTTLPTSELTTELERICQLENVQALVVGLPMSENGLRTSQTEFVERQVEDIQDFIHLPIRLVDEVLTTQEAIRQMQEAGISAADINRRVDQYAAKLILQQYLNEHDPADLED